MSKFEKVRGSVGKGAKSVSFTIPLKDVNFKKPASISSRGYAGFVNTYVEFEIEVDGITLPVDGKIGLYVSPKNWKEFQKQVEGKREGKALDKKADEVDALKSELADVKALLAQLTAALS